ncbi:MAG: hypothetical protein ACI9F2_000884 [Lysobacterales bacterium]|jgi:hypothetical protein
MAKPNNEKRDLLVFGYGLAVIIPTLVLLHARKHGVLGPIGIALLCGAAVALIISIIDINKIKPFYNKWMKVAHFIGTVVMTIVLSVFYFIVFMPAGIVMRILGKDNLEEKIDKKAKSYWHKREKVAFEQKSYQNQY